MPIHIIRPIKIYTHKYNQFYEMAFHACAKSMALNENHIHA